MAIYTDSGRIEKIAISSTQNTVYLLCLVKPVPHDYNWCMVSYFFSILSHTS